jgi:hypothetical protein
MTMTAYLATLPTRSLRRRQQDTTFFPLVLVDLRYRQPPEDQEDVISLKTKEYHDETMSLKKSDRMSIAFSEGDEISTTNYMEYVDGIDDLGERFTRLKLGSDFFKMFFGNATIDEKGTLHQ